MQMRVLITFLILLFFYNTGFSALACQQIFHKSNHVDISAVVQFKPTEQWLRWEQSANFYKFHQSHDPVPMGMVLLPAKEFDVSFSNSAPSNLQKLVFSSPETASWFQHPFNTDQKVPYTDLLPHKKVRSYLTASRSLAILVGENVFTIKLGTNRPHGFKGDVQSQKTQLQQDLKISKNRMVLIDQADALFGEDSVLKVAKDVGVIIDKSTNEGYVIRDLSFLNNGNFYLPAFSIPYVGRDIARINHQDPIEFWEKHYAQVLGQAKAKLLLRYGLQMETPNSQNFLIELDQNLKPTGKIVFRDLGDSQIVENFSLDLTGTDFIQLDQKYKIQTIKSYKPYWKNSSWRMDQAQDKSFDFFDLYNWGRAHDAAYLKELESALSINLNQFIVIDNNPELDQFLNSELVKDKLSKYRQKRVK